MIIGLALATLATAALIANASNEQAQTPKAPDKELAIATFAGGCFWCLRLLEWKSRAWFGCDDRWFLDQVTVSMQEKRRYLWRAVDQDGDVVDILIQKRKDTQAAKRFFGKLPRSVPHLST